MDKFFRASDLEEELNEYYKGNQLIYGISIVLNTVLGDLDEYVWEVQAFFAGYPRGSVRKAYKIMYVREVNMVKDYVVRVIEDHYAAWLGEVVIEENREVLERPAEGE
jgi:hypothetical protein